MRICGVRLGHSRESSDCFLLSLLGMQSLASLALHREVINTQMSDTEIVGIHNMLEWIEFRHCCFSWEKPAVPLPHGKWNKMRA